MRASRKTGQNKLSVEGSLTYARSSIRVLNDQNGNGEIDSVQHCLGSAGAASGSTNRR